MSATPSALAPAPAHRVFSGARVWAIASNTLLELVRQKVFYFLLIFSLLLIASSLILVKLSFQEQFQVLKDASLAAMSIFTWLLAVLATAMILPRDLEDRTLYTILAKPVSRIEYLAGKLLGVAVMLLIATALMAAVFCFVLYFRLNVALAEAARSTPPDQLQAALQAVRDSAFNTNLIAGVVLIYLKALLCAALTLFISTFATSWIFTILISMSAYFIGHVQGIARDYWLNTNVPSVLTKIFLALVALLFPDLQAFSLIEDIATGAAVPFILFIKASGLGLVYTIVYLLAGWFVFASREL